MEQQNTNNHKSESLVERDDKTFGVAKEMITFIDCMQISNKQRVTH